MNRREIYKDMENTLGVVPSFFKKVPDSCLELEWNLFKKIQLEESSIPNKYRELIGLAIAGVTKCHYCAFYHTEVAKLFGATDEEIEDALRYAQSTIGWSTYVNGMQIDFEQFKNEITQACEHVRSKEAVLT